MTDVLPALVKAVQAQSRTDQVALLLSSGIDSLSVAIALQRAGKSVSAYTFEVEGFHSQERAKVEWLARHFGWPLTIVSVPTGRLSDDFLELAVTDRCRTKVQFEVLWPLLYVLPQIAEDEVWSGWNADDHYGNTLRPSRAQAALRSEGVPDRERKQSFDAWRQDLRAKFFHRDSQDSWWFARRLAERLGKRLLDPYMDDSVFDLFLEFNHEQLSPMDKPVVREALCEHLKDILPGTISCGVRLQKGGKVHELFKSLLSDPQVNKYGNRSVPALCQRWGREVSADERPYFAELEAAPPRIAARTRRATPDIYLPYTMADVQDASKRAAFTFVSMFAGGGGSSIGYRSAGGCLPSGQRVRFRGGENLLGELPANGG